MRLDFTAWVSDIVDLNVFGVLIVRIFGQRKTSWVSFTWTRGSYYFLQEEVFVAALKNSFLYLRCKKLERDLSLLLDNFYRPSHQKELKKLREKSQIVF